MTPDELAAIEADHQPSKSVGGLSGRPFCQSDDHDTSTYWPCQPARFAAEVRTLTEQLADQDAAISRVRALHPETAGAYCPCGQRQPCETRAALAGVGQPESKPCAHPDITNNRCIDCDQIVPWTGVGQ